MRSIHQQIGGQHDVQCPANKLLDAGRVSGIKLRLATDRTVTLQSFLV